VLVGVGSGVAVEVGVGDGVAVGEAVGVSVGMGVALRMIPAAVGMGTVTCWHAANSSGMSNHVFCRFLDRIDDLQGPSISPRESLHFVLERYSRDRSRESNGLLFLRSFLQDRDDTFCLLA
jgi:hypothetical protein